MNKYIAIILTLILVVLGGGFYGLLKNGNVENPFGGNDFSYHKEYLNGNEATTTKTHMLTTDASSTLAFYSERADQVSFNLTIDASTTVPTLFYEVQSSENNIDWFGNVDDTDSSNTQQSLGGTAQIYDLAIATSTGVTTYYLNTPPISLDSKYSRVLFHTTGGEIGLHTEAVIREPNRR